MPYLLGAQLKNKALKVSTTCKRITFSMSDDFMSCTYTVQNSILFILLAIPFLLDSEDWSKEPKDSINKVESEFQPQVLRAKKPILYI